MCPKRKVFSEWGRGDGRAEENKKITSETVLEDGLVAMGGEKDHSCTEYVERPTKSIRREGEQDENPKKFLCAGGPTGGWKVKGLFQETIEEERGVVRVALKEKKQGNLQVTLVYRTFSHSLGPGRKKINLRTHTKSRFDNGNYDTRVFSGFLSEKAISWEKGRQGLQKQREAKS